MDSEYSLTVELQTVVHTHYLGLLTFQPFNYACEYGLHKYNYRFESNMGANDHFSGIENELLK